MPNTFPDLKGGIPDKQRWPHPNSRKAFESLCLGPRHQEIYELCVRENRPLTDRQIKKLLEYTDMNKCRPRISELIDHKLLKECGKVRDEESGKSVRQVVWMRQKEHQMTLPGTQRFTNQEKVS